MARKELLENQTEERRNNCRTIDNEVKWFLREKKYPLQISAIQLILQWELQPFGPKSKHFPHPLNP